MTAAISSLHRKFILPMMYFNGTLMVVSLAWLAMSDMALIALYGIIGLILGPAILPFLLVPGTICAEIIGRFPRVRFISLVTVPAGFGFTLPLTVYACSMFYLAGGAFVTASLVPAAAWAFSAAMMPWCIYARKHADNSFVPALLLVMQVCVAAVMLAGICARLNIYAWFWMMWFAAGSVFSVVLFRYPALLEKARTISS